MWYLKDANFANYTSVRIVEKIIIFVNAKIIANGTGKGCQYVLNSTHDMLLILYLLAAA